MTAAVAAALVLALVTILGIDLAPLLITPHKQPAHSGARAQARLLQGEPEAGPDAARSPGPAGTVPADGPPVHAGAVPFTPRGRHHASQPRQPWDTAELPAVPACETEPVPEPELYTCEPHEAVPGFYRHHIWQQYRRLS